MPRTVQPQVRGFKDRPPSTKRPEAPPQRRARPSALRTDSLPGCAAVQKNGGFPDLRAVSTDVNRLVINGCDLLRMFTFAHPFAATLAKTMETRPQAETAEGLGKFMVVGLLVISTLAAAIGAGLSLYLGSGWLGAIGVYFATGTATSFLLVLNLIVVELRKPDNDGTAPVTAGERPRACYSKAT